MSWSFGEIRSLSIKASRGAGMPWGLAEEAGFAVQWLEERGLPGVAALSACLEESDASGDINGETCPVAIGARLSDAGEWRSVFPTKLHQPLLVVPFLALVTGEESLELAWNNQKVLLNQTGVTGNLPEQVTASGVHRCEIRSDVVSIPSLHRWTRVPENRKPGVERLEWFAHKTYAPATAASREKGAGAGLDDND